MNKNFSLTFPLIRLIHEHHQNPHENRVMRFCQQQLIDRVVALSLPLFAFFDVLSHLSASLVEGVNAGYKSLINHEVFSIDKAIRHLKIGWLFTEVIFTGASYVIKPHTISTIFVNSLTQSVRALLLSGSPEVFVNSAKAGGTSLPELLEVFCAKVKQLPEDIQETMAETLKLVREANQFERTISPKDSYLSLSCEHGFRNLEESFENLKAIEGSIFTKLFKREIHARFDILMMALFGLFATPISLLASLGTLLREVSVALLTNQDTQIPTILWRIRLDLITLLRMYMTFPLTVIGGVIDPFKVQSLFFSPLYKGDEKVKDETVKLLFKKIKALKTRESALVPLFTYTDDPYKNRAHGYYILVTKQDVHYRVSIINRGWGSESHRCNDLNQLNADVSYDNFPFKKIKEYLASLIALKEFHLASIVYKTTFVGRLQGIDPFKLMLYAIPALWSFEEGSTIIEFQSNHVSSSQKIGNCGIANLMSAISFHSSTQTGDMSNKTPYKRFIYSYKKMMFENYNYLLDFDLQVKKNGELPSSSAERQLDKMKRKLGNVDSNKGL
jgi:hypothetical protein